MLGGGGGKVERGSGGGGKKMLDREHLLSRIRFLEASSKQVGL